MMEEDKGLPVTVVCHLGDRRAAKIATRHVDSLLIFLACYIPGRHAQLGVQLAELINCAETAGW